MVEHRLKRVEGDAVSGFLNDYFDLCIGNTLEIVGSDKPWGNGQFRVIVVAVAQTLVFFLRELMLEDVQTNQVVDAAKEIVAVGGNLETAALLQQIS